MVEEVLASPFTRLPLWQDDPDNIVGVLHVKALLRAVQAANGRELDKLDVRAIATPPWFIPDTTDLLSQLQAFRSDRTSVVEGKSVSVSVDLGGRRIIKKKNT